MEKEQTINEGEASAVYEVSYLLLPSFAEEHIAEKASAIKEKISSFGGTLISDENPVLIDLSYSMTKVIGTDRHKATSGYFGWVKFEIEKDGLVKVKKALDSNDDILRFLLLKTVKENTLLHGKMMFKKEEKIKKDDEEVIEEVHEEAIKEPVSEDLDKSIDDLVIA